MDKAISLKTLDKVAAQDIFNHVVNHLMSQKERSADSEGACMYRGPNGLKCAAGCLIADDEYSPEMEYSTWLHLMDEGASYRGNGKLVVPTAHSDLIHALQTVHDRDAPDKWEEALRKLCAEHMLKWEYGEKVDD